MSPPEPIRRAAHRRARPRAVRDHVRRATRRGHDVRRLWPAFPPTDTLIAAGGDAGVRATLATGELTALIRAAAAKGARIVSVCTGAFFLAAAGVLDGRRAATHWRAVERLRRFRPAVQVDPESIYVRDGDVWTSAGVTAGIDLALAIIEADCGRETALTVARRHVVFPIRPGGQGQFAPAARRRRGARPAVGPPRRERRQAPGGGLAHRGAGGRGGGLFTLPDTAVSPRTGRHAGVFRRTRAHRSGEAGTAENRRLGGDDRHRLRFGSSTPDGSRLRAHHRGHADRVPRPFQRPREAPYHASTSVS